MDLKRWQISIYDEYIKEYYLKYPTVKKKFKDLSKQSKIQLLFIFVTMIGGFLAYIYGLIFKEISIIFISIFCITLVPGLTIYTEKIDINIYRRKIKVLQNVLRDQGLDNEKSIRKLEQDTRGIFGRITNEGINIIKIIFSFISAAGFSVILRSINKQALYTIVGIVFVILLLAVALYCILMCIPDGQIERKKQLNQLLKILIIYKGY